MDAKKARIVLGLDPGTVKTGYGIIERTPSGDRILDYGCIAPPPALSLPDRYLIIFRGVRKLVQNFQPQDFAYEAQYVGINPRSALKLGMACSAALVAALDLGLSPFEYTASEAKKAVVGTGQASKMQVQAMLQKLFSLSQPPSPQDAADALALALCHLQRTLIT